LVVGWEAVMVVAVMEVGSEVAREVGGVV